MDLAAGLLPMRPTERGTTSRSDSALSAIRILRHYCLIRRAGLAMQFGIRGPSQPSAVAVSDPLVSCGQDTSGSSIQRSSAAQSNCAVRQ
jgi:hypothetical protein